MKSESQNIEYKESWRDNMPIAYKGTTTIAVDLQSRFR